MKVTNSQYEGMSAAPDEAVTTVAAAAAAAGAAAAAAAAAGLQGNIKRSSSTAGSYKWLAAAVDETHSGSVSAHAVYRETCTP